MDGDDPGVRRYEDCGFLEANRMLSLGMGELLVIGAVLLIFVGPERLPHMMRWAGKQYGMLRRAADDMRRAFVLEADRQDAEERYQELQSRRQEAKKAREEALQSAGAGTVAQDEALPPPDRAPNPDSEHPIGPEPLADPEARPALPQHPAEPEPSVLPDLSEPPRMVEPFEEEEL